MGISWGKEVVEMQNVVFRYEGLLGSPHFEFKCDYAQIQNGKMYAIIGPNGSGKSTALSLLYGANKPDKGSIIFKENNKEVAVTRSSIALIEPKDKESLAEDLRVIDYMAAASNKSWFGLVRPYFFCKQSFISVFERYEAANSFLEKNMYKLIGELSSGQKQFLAVLLNIVLERKLVLADEPTVFLDYEWSKSIIELLKDVAEKLGVPVLFVTHDLELVARSGSEIFFVDNGVFCPLSCVDRSQLSHEARVILSQMERFNV